MFLYTFLCQGSGTYHLSPLCLLLHYTLSRLLLASHHPTNHLESFCFLSIRLPGKSPEDEERKCQSSNTIECFYFLRQDSLSAPYMYGLREKLPDLHSLKLHKRASAKPSRELGSLCESEGRICQRHRFF